MADTFADDIFKHNFFYLWNCNENILKFRVDLTNYAHGSRYVVFQGSFLVWAQLMREDSTTLSTIGSTHTQNGPRFASEMLLLGYFTGTGQSYHCFSASEETLKDMCKGTTLICKKWWYPQYTTKSKTKPVCIFIRYTIDVCSVVTNSSWSREVNWLSRFPAPVHSS